MKKISAKAPVIGGKQYHIACGVGDVAPSVLVPGDPARVRKIASLWDSAKSQRTKPHLFPSLLRALRG